MVWLDILLIIVFALVLSIIVAYGLGWRHPARRDAVGISALFLFLVLLFAMWAGGVWLPVSVTYFYGRPWLGFLLIGSLVCLLVLAVAEPISRVPTSRQAAAEAREAAAAGRAFGVFFWVLLLGLLALAVMGHLV